VKFLDDIELDFLWGGMVSTPVKALKAMGCNSYDLGNDGTTIIHRQPDIEFMKAEEYPELIADMQAIKQKLLRRRCKALGLPRDQAYACVLQALKEIRPWFEANDMIRKTITKTRASPR
jgi:hypothetical protein